jgi:uncharacterized protein YkwD
MTGSHRSRPASSSRAGVRRAVRLSLLALATVFLAACAHTNATRRTGQSQRYLATGTPASEYRTEPTATDAFRGPHAARVAQGFQRALDRRGVRLVPDGRLGELAARVGDALDAQGSPPPYAAIDLWTHHLGLFEPAPHLLVLAQSDASTLADRVEREIAPILGQQQYTHFGAATLERDGTVFAVLVLSWRWANLETVPRSIAPGSEIALRGALLNGVHDAELVVSYPDGTNFRTPATAGKNFALQAPTRGRGEHRVELLANSALGDTVVANFPVYVGVPPATEVVVAGEVADASGAQLDEAAAKRHLLELVNAERSRAGLSTLTLNEPLSRIARAHSQDMQVHNFVGHNSPTTGDASARVKRADVRTSLVLENIGRGYSADEVHRGLMDSPGHRANVLNPDATDIGLGLVLAPEDQRMAYLVTELFARFAKKVDVEEATAELFASVNRERVRRGLSALRNDATMAGLAATTAQTFFDQPHSDRQRLVEQLNKLTASKRLGYTRIGTLMTVVSAPDEAAAIDTLLDPKARGLGLGLAQGTREDTIENAIAVVALIGY